MEEVKDSALVQLDVKTPPTSGLPAAGQSELCLDGEETLRIQNIELRAQLNAERATRLELELQNTRQEAHNVEGEMMMFRAYLAKKHGIDPMAIRIRRDGVIEVASMVPPGTLNPTAIKG